MTLCSRSLARAALIVALVYSVVGCAVTRFGREQNAKYESMGRTIDRNRPVLLEFEQGSISFQGNCNSFYTYTGMLSPFVPLPPIIPVWFLNYNGSSSFQLFLHGHGMSYIKPNMAVMINGQKVESLLSQKVRIQDTIMLSFSSAPCLELDGATLTFSGVMYNGKPLKIPPVTISVKKGDYKFEYGYIHD